MSKNANKHIDEQFQSLLETVERIRIDRFPHLDAELVRDLLRVHADGSTADADIARETERQVEARLTLGA